MSLAIEALTQAFESRRPDELTLRDFVFQEALPCIKTDEILELQTCIQPIRSRASQEETYLVGIESVRDGRWTTHCEGTAVISTYVDQNGSKTQTNGTNTQDLAEKYDRNTKILKKITDEDSDPYQLHPLTIYGCLQHTLMSAASGRHHGEDSGDHGDLKSGNKAGLKIAEIEELRLWSSKERTSGGEWTAHASNRDAELKDEVACVDMDLKDETGAVASTISGLKVTRCEGEAHEAFDTDLPPPDPKARIPAFLRPLLG